MFYAAITPLLPKLVDDLDLGKNGAGVLTGAYAAGTLVGSLPAGWLIARFGVKATVIVGLTLMSVSCLVFAFARHIGLLDAARFLQGVGGACSWAGGMAWLAGEAPRERRGALLGSAMGFAIFGVQLGPVVRRHRARGRPGVRVLDDGRLRPGARRLGVDDAGPPRRGRVARDAGRGAAQPGHARGHVAHGAARGRVRRPRRARAAAPGRARRVRACARRDVLRRRRGGGRRHAARRPLHRPRGRADRHPRRAGGDGRGARRPADPGHAVRAGGRRDRRLGAARRPVGAGDRPADRAAPRRSGSTTASPSPTSTSRGPPASAWAPSPAAASRR